MQQAIHQTGNETLTYHLGLAAVQFSAQALVAQASRLGIQLTDDQAEILGHRNHLAHMRPALGLVAVEQRIGCLAAMHQAELPHQIGCITHPGAQPLSEKGRRLMRGIAQQEHIALAPALGHQGMEAIHRHPPQLQLADIDELAQHPQHLRLFTEILGGFTRQQLDLPAAQAARPAHEGARTRRPAVLDAFGRQWQIVVGKRIDNDPPFIERQVLQRQRQLLAHKARAAITGEQPARAGAMPAASGIAPVQLD